ncbi:MAG: TonB-dependent receptor [Bacteroidales bacterium]|nr:TonB-dependent receptor [Bacteroidales bacterium]
MKKNYPLKRLLQMLLPSIALMLLGFQGHSQRIISGTVIASDNGETLPGVNVLVKGTTRGTTTDFKGVFQLEVQPADKVLAISFIGYKDQEVTIGNQQVLRIVLQVSSTELEEFVVIGYGTIRKSDLTGAVSSLKAEDIRKITALNPEQSLQGKVTGVQITTTSGAPGAGAAVRIRGVGTFNDSSPIYVVDGVILGDISFLNSADISSIEVLKDASATAIYGSRGANGVILVQTKKGIIGQEKPVFSFSSEYSIQHLAKKIDLLDGRQFAIISNEIKAGSYNNVDAVPNTDWQDLVFQTAPIQNHQLSITGATSISQYYVGIGLFQQDGIIPKSNYQRITLKLNNTYHLSKYFRLGNNITLAPYEQRNAPNATYAVYRAQPLLVPYYPDGSFGVVYNVGNPLADLEYSNNFNKGLRGVGNIFAEATLFNDFALKTSYGLDASYNKMENFTPAFTVFNPEGTATQQFNEFSDLFKGSNESIGWLWENTLTYNKRINKHNINTVGGFTMQKTRSEYFGLSGQNLIRNEPNFWYIQPAYIINEANNINMLQSIFNGVDPKLYYSMMSFLFRSNYTFDNRYIFTVTFRRDGSSKFSKQNRYSNFPSFALGWNVVNEQFMQPYKAISNLKLRVSWGKIGNEKISYFDRFARVQSDLLVILSNPDVSFPAASYGKSGNADLKWETTAQTDIGLEVGALNNRLTGEFDFYHRVTDDILLELSTPGHAGNGQGQRVTYNAASVLNRGFEFNIRWREKWKDFSYSVGILGTTIHNEVLSIGGNSGVDSTLIGGWLGDGQPVTLSRVGLPIGAFYGYKTDGIFQTQAELDAYPHMSLAEVGDLRFVDVNGDKKINGLDRTYIGSPIPKFIYGFNVELQYKAFDLSLDIAGQTGNKIFNGKDVVRPDPYNFEQNVWNRWTGPGTSNTEPKASFGGYNYTPSDRFIQDGSFVRLRNFSVSYTLPQTFTKKMSMQQVRVYLKGTNLFTLTKFTGYTPEIGSYDVLSNGIDYGIYPISAVYSVGLNVTF